MRTIGFRAKPNKIIFAIYDVEADEVVNIEDIIIPAAFDLPEALKYIRGTVLDILREYEISRAGVRTTEFKAQKFNLKRVQVEGVIQESFADSELSSFYVGQIANISHRVGIDRGDFKKFVSGDLEFGVENWPSLSPEQREAVLCAKGAANA